MQLACCAGLDLDLLIEKEISNILNTNIQY